MTNTLIKNTIQTIHDINAKSICSNARPERTKSDREGKGKTSPRKDRRSKSNTSPVRRRTIRESQRSLLQSERRSKNSQKLREVENKLHKIKELTNWLFKKPEPTFFKPEYFQDVDKEQCHILNLYDNVILGIKPIVCYECGGELECTCINGINYNTRYRQWRKDHYGKKRPH